MSTKKAKYANPVFDDIELQALDEFGVPEFSGQAYQAASGQWSWRVCNASGVELVGGAGYASEDDALRAMWDELDHRRGLHA